MKSFRFKETWLRAVESISDPAIQAELMLAIARYGIHRTYTPSANDTVNSVMQIVIMEIDAKASSQKSSDSQTVEQIEHEQELFSQAEDTAHTVAMHASTAAHSTGIGKCFLHFRSECLAHRRFHSSRHELLNDFRRRISKDVYGIPKAESHFFKEKPR